MSDVQAPDIEAVETEAEELDFDAPQFTIDNDLPGDLSPKKQRRSRKRERETAQTVAEALAMLNGMFGMMVPCSCEARLPLELHDTGAHIEDCAKLYPLDENEMAALSGAIEAELLAHPEWIDKLQNADTWVAHAMLVSAVFGIVMARRMRSARRILLPENAAPEIVNAAMAYSQNGQYANPV